LPQVFRLDEKIRNPRVAEHDVFIRIQLEKQFVFFGSPRIRLGKIGKTSEFVSGGNIAFVVIFRQRIRTLESIAFQRSHLGVALPENKRDAPSLSGIRERAHIAIFKIEDRGEYRRILVNLLMIDDPKTFLVTGFFKIASVRIPRIIARIDKKLEHAGYRPISGNLFDIVDLPEIDLRQKKERFSRFVPRKFARFGRPIGHAAKARIQVAPRSRRIGLEIDALF
jgi:hypothetical protein